MSHTSLGHRMTDLDALLAGIVADPHNHLRWLIVADWLDDHGQPERAELLRLHRMLIDTCCEPDQHPDRAAWQARIVELIDRGATPCVPQHTLTLPGGVPLVGNFIPPGSFLMGSEEQYGASPVHRVTLTTGFYLGIYPVTQAQWHAVMGTNPSEFQGANRPVENVTWEDALDFCEAVSSLLRHPIRLPTEAWWEYACRAGTTTRFHYGDEATTTRMNACGRWGPNRLWTLDPPAQTTEVVAYPGNPWGLFDTHGNVEEWCSDTDWDEFYSVSPAVDPEHVVEDQEYSISRGGAWRYAPQDCSSSHRGGEWILHQSSAFGFRVAFTLS